MPRDRFTETLQEMRNQRRALWFGRTLLMFGVLALSTGLFAAAVELFVRLDGSVRPIEAQALGLLYIIAGFKVLEIANG